MFKYDFQLSNGDKNKGTVYLPNIECPVLFLQGLKDNPYRCADAKMAYSIMKNNNLPAVYIELPDGNHGLDNVSDEAIGHIFNWFSVYTILK
jgi:dipeptidyl aminopeptidase/acylaminoacyl peptidase